MKEYDPSFGRKSLSPPRNVLLPALLPTDYAESIPATPKISFLGNGKRLYDQYEYEQFGEDDLPQLNVSSNSVFLARAGILTNISRRICLLRLRREGRERGLLVLHARPHCPKSDSGKAVYALTIPYLTLP